MREARVETEAANVPPAAVAISVARVSSRGRLVVLDERGLEVPVAGADFGPRELAARIAAFVGASAWGVGRAH